jgi:membrane protein required for colicin V production
MPVLDWIFAAVLLGSLLLGAWRGLVYEVLSLLSWFAAFVAAQWLALDAAQYLPMGGASDTMRYAAGFVLVFLIVVVLGSLVAVVVKKLTTAVGLRPVDRALGAVFGSLRGLLLLLTGTVLLGMTPMKSSAAWQESVGVEAAGAVLKGLKPVLPRDIEKFLPTE